MRGAATALAVLAVVVAAAPVGAQTPVDYRRTTVFVQPSLSARHFVGPLGDRSGWSLGVGVTQGVQFGYFGFHVTLDTDYFLSDQQPPPFNSGFQISGFDVAGRFAYPLGDFRLFATAGYRRVGFISNTLVLQTGPDLAYHALSTGAGVRLVQLAPFYVELSSSWAWLPALDRTSLFGVSLALGVRTVL